MCDANTSTTSAAAAATTQLSHPCREEELCSVSGGRKRRRRLSFFVAFGRLLLHTHYTHTLAFSSSSSLRSLAAIDLLMRKIDKEARKIESQENTGGDGTGKERKRKNWVGRGGGETREEERKRGPWTVFSLLH